MAKKFPVPSASRLDAHLRFYGLNKRLPFEGKTFAVNLLTVSTPFRFRLFIKKFSVPKISENFNYASTSLDFVFGITPYFLIAYPFS